MRTFLSICLLCSALSADAAFPRVWHFPFVPSFPAGNRFTADAGPDQSITVFSATLAGSVSPTGAYFVTWSQVSGPDAAGFVDAHSLTTTAVFDRTGTWVLRVRAFRGLRYSEDTVTITVGTPANQAPTITPIANVSTTEDTVIARDFTIGDDLDPVGTLTVLAVSSATGVLPNVNAVISGTGATRTITLTPIANAVGITTVTISVSDSGGAVTQTSFTVNWVAVNDPPTLSAIGAQTSPEDTPKTINFTVGDVETVAGSLTVTATTSTPAIIDNIALSGTGANRTAVIGPQANVSGVGSVTISVTDGNAITSETFSMTFTAVNDPPQVTASFTALQGTNGVLTRAVSLALLDVDDAVSTLTVTATSDNQTVQPDAAISVSGTGTPRTLTMTPAVVGTATITVTVKDPSNASGTATVNLVVGSGNTAPSITGPGNKTVLEDNSLAPTSFTISDAQTAPNLLVVTAHSSDQTKVQDSGITLAGTTGTRTIAITPVANANGAVTITLIVTDAGGLTAQDTFTFTITAVNDPPVISSIAAQSTPEDVAKAVAFTVSDVETAAGSLTPSAVSSNPALVSNDAGHLTFSGSGANRTLTITPLLNQTGTTTITLSVSDGTDTTSTIFVLTVAPVDDPPTISVISPFSVAEDGISTPVTVTLTDVDTLPANLALSAISSDHTILLDSGVHFSVQSGLTRTFTVQPIANANGGPFNVTINVTDGTSTVGSTFALTVTPVNDPPTIANVPNQTLAQGSSSLAITVGINDIDTTIASLTITATTSDASVLPLSGIVATGSGASRTVTFTPTAVGTATVTLTVSDGSLTATTPSFTVTKPPPINTAPTISNIPDQSITPAGSTVGFTVSDAETPAASLLVAVTANSNPALTPASGLTFGGSGSARTLTIVPAAGQSGTSTLIVTTTDAGGLTASDSFVVTVTIPNTAPTISSVSAQSTPEDTPVSFTFTVSDTQTPAGSLIVSVFSDNTALVPVANVAISGTATRTALVTPVLNQSGTVHLTFTVSDGSLSSQMVVTLTVSPVNDPPTISTLVNQTVSVNTPNTQNVTVFDVETPLASLTLSGTSSDTTLVANSGITFGGSGGNRTVTVTPVSGQSGRTATITVTVNDGTGGNNSSSFTFTVTAAGVNTFYAAPNGVGLPGNPGTEAAPWDINSILNRTTKNLQSGATVILLPGTYPVVGNSLYTFSNYDQAGYIEIVAKNRVWGPNAGATIFDGNNATRGDGCINGTPGSANRIRFRNLVGINTALRQTWPSGNTDRRNFVYWTMRGYVQFVNCWSQDSGNGFGFEDSVDLPGGNALFYGNVSCLNGSPGDDDAHHGHNWYVQCKHLTDRVDFINNVSHNACGQGWQVRTGDEGIFLANTYLYGNVFYNNGYAGMDVSNGQLAAPSPTRNLFFGGGERARDYSVVSNFTYYALPAGGPSAFFQNPTANTSCSVGGGTYGPHPNYNTNLTAVGNTIIGGEMEWGRWINAIITNNLIAAGSSRTALIWMDEFTVDPGCPASWPSPFDTGPLGDTVDWNFLFGQNLYSSTRFGGMSATTWKANTTFGDHDIVSSANGPSTNIVTLFPNQFDSKLALLVIYNPSGASSVSVSLSGFLVTGDTYDVYSTTSRTVRHSNGVYNGSAPIPMTGFPLTAMVGYQSGPNLGGMKSPEPFFGAFTIIKTN